MTIEALLNSGRLNNRCSISLLLARRASGVSANRASSIFFLILFFTLLYHELVERNLDLLDLFPRGRSCIIGRLPVKIGSHGISGIAHKAQELHPFEVFQDKSLFHLGPDLVADDKDLFHAKSMSQRFDLAGGLHAPLARLHHHDERIDASGRTAGQVLDTRLHIKVDHLITLQNEVAHQAAKQHMLRTVAARCRFF